MSVLKARLQVNLDPAVNHLLRNKAHARQNTITLALENAIKTWAHSSDQHVTKCVNLFTSEQGARENAIGTPTDKPPKP